MSAPLVSVGMPVYNGLPYLQESLESVLSQSFSDFELLISDNASTDDTWSVCQRFARDDSRISLFQNATNIGAAPNANGLFRHARGRYFKWAAADDLCDPTYLQRCVDILENRPDVTVCHAYPKFIDGEGAELPTRERSLNVEHESRTRRFARTVFCTRSCTAIFGVIRSRALHDTRLFGSFPSADLVLLTELAILGKIHEIPEQLFLKREHKNTSMAAYQDMRSRADWFSRNPKGKACPRWRLLREHVRVINRHMRNPPQRGVSYLPLTDLVRRTWPKLIGEAMRFGAETVIPRRISPNTTR